MEEIWKNSAIITKRNVDDGQNPISVQLSELKQIIDVHSCIVLNQLPDEFHGVYIDGYTEVYDIEKVSINNYKVDYANGVIYFHPNNIGKILNVDYYGIGYTLLSASRIYTKYDKNGGVLETLEELLDKGELYIEAIETLGGAVEVVNEMRQSIADSASLHENLLEDISTGLAVRDDLEEKTDIANTTINSLVTKTQDGNNTVNQLIEKNAIATEKKQALDSSIQSATDTNTTLSNTNQAGTQINLTLQQTMAEASDDIATINATGNKSLIIGASNFTNGEYTWTHGMNSDDLHVTFEKLETKEPVLADYQRIDKNNILIRNSEENPNLKVILSASYYQGNSVIGSTVEEFLGDSIGINEDKVRLRGVNGEVQNPVTNSDAVFMSDGVTKLTNKISDITDEIDEARGANQFLGDRLDNIDASLEEKTNKTDTLLRNTKKVPTISITSDDGREEEVTLIAPVLKEYNIPCSCALVTGQMNRVSERLELQNKHGWEFASHTVDHVQLGTITPEEMEYQLRESKRQLEEVGFKANSIVYPVGSADITTKRLAKKYFKAGYSYNNKNNIGMLDSFTIGRIPLGSNYIGDKATVSTLEYYKSKIDEAYANNGWVIFCLHVYHPDNDTTQWQYLREVIEYAQSLNFKFATYSEGYEIHGNALEVGDSDSPNRVVIDNDGNSNIPIVKMTAGIVKATDDISAYPKDKISICQIGNFDNAGFPENTGGILETHRTNDFAFQYFYVRNNNNEYRRVYNGGWGQFEIMRDLISNIGITNSTPISSFTKDKITITRIGNFDNAGFPEGKAGILTTYRNGADDVFSYQIFNSVTSGYCYKRYWKTMDWGEWELIIIKASSVCFNLDMSTSFQKTPTYINKYVSIDKFFSSSGTQPTLTKEVWALSELSTNSTSPTILGTAGSGRNILGYIQDKVLYISYSSVGNNYNSFFRMSFC